MMHAMTRMQAFKRVPDGNSNDTPRGEGRSELQESRSHSPSYCRPQRISFRIEAAAQPLAVGTYECNEQQNFHLVHKRRSNLR